MMFQYAKRTLQSIVLAAGMMAGCTVGESPRELIPYEPYFHDTSQVDAGPLPEPRELTVCGDAGLVDLLENDENCGACGVPCDESTSCYDGACRFPAYLDEPCGPDGWCPTEDMACVTFDSGDYCIDRFKWGCEFHDACDQAEREICISDECVTQIEVCIDAYCSPFSDEFCDGRDNDRNGMVDDIPPRTCYTGPEGTAGVGICRSGIELCRDGAWTACAGERHPVAEEHILLCDGRDNDCDGCADNNYDPDTGGCIDAEPIEYDIVVIMDISGSMEGIIRSAVAAATEFAEAFDGDPNFRFSLLSHPYAADEPISRSLDIPLGDYAIYRAALPALLTRRTGVTGAEQNYDIPHMVATGAYPEIGFRSTARRVYINFTDEHGQSNPYAGFSTVDEPLMCSAFGSEDVVAFVTRPAIYSYFGDCSILFELRYDPIGMASELRSLFEEVCLH